VRRARGGRTAAAHGRRRSVSRTASCVVVAQEDLAAPRSRKAGREDALDLNRERREFAAADVIWDETHRVCIVDVVWEVADDASMLAAVKAASARARLTRSGRRKLAVLRVERRIGVHEQLVNLVDALERAAQGVMRAKVRLLPLDRPYGRSHNAGIV
jgi:hypothetical protein